MKCCPEVFKQSLHKHPLKSLMNMPLITTFSDITSSLHNLVTGGLSSIAFLIYTCTHTYNMNTYIHTYIYSQMHKIPTTTYMHTKTYIHTHVCMTLYVYMHVPKKCKNLSLAAADNIFHLHFHLNWVCFNCADDIRREDHGEYENARLQKNANNL